MTGWFFGAVLSGLALPGVALAGALPAAAAVLSVNDNASAAGAPPAPPAVSPAPPAAPTAGGAAPPSPPPPAPYPPPAYAPPPPAYAPPPPGYYSYPPAGYPPPAYLPPAAYAAQRLAVLDAQIRDLEARLDDINLTLPIVLLIGGAAIGVVGLAIVGANKNCATDVYGNREDPYCVENSSAREQGLALVGVGALGVAFGATSLIIRTARRRHIGRQIQARQIEADALRAFATPRWGVSPVRGGGGVVSLALDF